MGVSKNEGPFCKSFRTRILTYLGLLRGHPFSIWGPGSFYKLEGPFLGVFYMRDPFSLVLLGGPDLRNLLCTKYHQNPKKACGRRCGSLNPGG